MVFIQPLSTLMNQLFSVDSELLISQIPSLVLEVPSQFRILRHRPRFTVDMFLISGVASLLIISTISIVLIKLRFLSN